jgi:hypothetical protein
VRGVAKLCTYHEYRISLGLAALVGVITGIADAAIDDWAVKAFTWAAILMLYAMIVAYELIVMPTPPKPLLQAFLFTLTAPLGLLSAHHWTWYMLTVMLGKPIEHMLWLAPNIYIDLNTYNTLMAASLAAYIAYLTTANTTACEKREQNK